jgi:arylsulfatase A-like enzyme/tetratricopeptide (TPR) repeat protein
LVRYAAVLLVTLIVAACGLRGSTPPPPSRPNIVLVTIDTFRGDRLTPALTPALARLAASGRRFSAARTAVPLTLPSHTTIMTGVPPSVHGVRENGQDRLSASHQTLARLLKGAGYETAAFVGAFVLNRQFGLAQGFDKYDDDIPRDPAAMDRLEAERPASAVVDRALAWLDQNAQGSAGRPFFLWIHLYDPHAPYNPPAEFLSRAVAARPDDRPVTQRYDGEIAYADAQISRVLDVFHAKQLDARTLLIVTGDHGEGLGDHGENTHGMLLYDSTLRVPLLIAGAGTEAGDRDDPVSLTDLAPTILGAAGIDAPAIMAGRNLLGPRKGSRTDSRNQTEIYAETEYPRVAGWSPLRALSDGRWKLISGSATAELFDLQNNPTETENLAVVQPSITGAMAARMENIATRDSMTVRDGGLSDRNRSGSSPVDDEAAARLRALGYVTGSSNRGGARDAPAAAVDIDAWNRFEEALTALSARRPEAISMLELLARQHPDAPVFQMTRARALKEAGRLGEALAVARASARRWPGDASALHDLAVTAREMASRGGSSAHTLYAEAERAEQAALDVSPDSAVSHNSLGLIAVDQGRPATAVLEFARATALDQSNASYWTNLGNARRAARQPDDAEQAYRRALQIDPKAVDAANGLGVLFVETNRAADAVPWFERAVAGSADFAEARLNLGIALQQSGDSARAADEYRRVLASPARDSREKEAAATLLRSLGASR